ncbi:MAG: Fic family protein [Candidatus Bathyarchaeia archaeon]
MHIETREKNGSKKYYLAHSFRDGSRVKKIRIFLGRDLTEETLNERAKNAETELQKRAEEAKAIRDPFLTVLSPVELKELKTLEARGELHVRHLSEVDWTKFKEAFTYNTNAIEGSRIDALEVQNILENQGWPQDKSKEDIAETLGVAEAVDYIRTIDEHISLKLIKELHSIVFKNSKSFAGIFRPKGVEVVVADAHGTVIHRGAPSEQIESLLKEIVHWYNQNKTKCQPMVLAAVVHNQFEVVHPFQDGNGRVGRLLLNNILLKHDLPPLNIELKNRIQYYLALQAYERENNIRPMLELMLKEYKALKRLFK